MRKSPTPILLLLPLLAALVSTAISADLPEVGKLKKNHPWTYDDIFAALKAGANHDALAAVLKAESTTNFYTADAVRLSNTPEGSKIKEFGKLSMTLAEHAAQGAGQWTFDMARAAVEARRQQTGRQPDIVDTAELRAKVAARDPQAMLDFYLLPEREHKLGAAPADFTLGMVAQRVLETKYVRGYWAVGEGYLHNADKTKENPALAAEYFYQSAVAGDPSGARALASQYLVSSDNGVAPNLIEAEYWLIEAAARGPKNVFEDIYNNPERDLAFLYSYGRPLGGPIFWTISIGSDEELRWARELIRRGGKLADVANVYLDDMERRARSRNLRGPYMRERMAALPPEVAPFSAADLTRLEATAKAGDVKALLMLGDAYAAGHGVHQHDAAGVEYYRQAAQKNSAPAARALYVAYSKGYGVKREPEQGAVWLQKAAEYGDDVAWRDLGDLLSNYNPKETGVAQNYPGAKAAYEKAAAKGDMKAVFSLSVMYGAGQGVTKDAVKEMALLKQSAEGGYPLAASWYARGLAKAQDWKNAIVWYQKSIAAGETGDRSGLAEALEKTGDAKGAMAVYQQMAEDGDALSQMRIARDLETKKDWKGALAWWQRVASNKYAYDFMVRDANQGIKACEEEINPPPGSIPALRQQADAGDAVAMLQLAFKLAPTDRVSAMEWARKSAEKGNNQAMLVYAGEMMATNKPAAFEWMTKSADAGNLEAKYRLAGVLIQGKDLPQDQARALKLISESADGGFPPAQFDYGRYLLTSGTNPLVDSARGIDLLKKAAQRLPQGAAVLGEVYEKGVGTPVNLKESLKWYQQARTQGIRQVQPAIDRVEIMLSGKTPPPPAAPAVTAPIKK